MPLPMDFDCETQAGGSRSSVTALRGQLINTKQESRLRLGVISENLCVLHYYNFSVTTSRFLVSPYISRPSFYYGSFSHY